MPRCLKVVLWVGFAACLGAAFWVWISPALAQKADLAAQRDALKESNDALQREIDELRRRQRDFRNDPEYVELVAREEGLVRPSETVYDFSGKR